MNTQLTEEDHAEIRANAARLFRGKILTFRVLGEKDRRRLSEFKRVRRAKCKHGLAQFACFVCTGGIVKQERELLLERNSQPIESIVKDRRIYDVAFSARRIFLWNEEVSFVGVDVPDHAVPRDLPPTLKTSTPLHRNSLVTVPDVSGGFRWNNRRSHRRSPLIQEMPRTAEAAYDAANETTEPAPVLPPWFKSYDIYVVGEKLPRESVKGYDKQKRLSFPVRNRFTGELEFVDPQFAPLCKSRKFGTYARLPIDALPECTEEEQKRFDELNKQLAALGMPQEPRGCDVIRVEGSEKRRVFRIQQESMWDDGSAEPFDEDKSPVGGLRIFSEPKMEYENLRLLTMYFRGATPEEVADSGKVMQWAYQVSVDPKSLSTFTKTQQRAIERKLKNMREQDEGRCPTGVCPTNGCASPELSFAERAEIHRTNTATFNSIEHLGQWFCWVMLNGQWYPKFLPLPLGETNPTKVQTAFRKLIRDEVNKAETRADRAARRAVFDAVEGLHFMEVVWDEEAAKTYVWDRLAGRAKVVDDATGEVHDFEGLSGAATAAD